MPAVLITKPRVISHFVHFEIAPAGFGTGEPGVTPMCLYWAVQQAASHSLKHHKQALYWSFGLACTPEAVNPMDAMTMVFLVVVDHISIRLEVADWLLGGEINQLSFHNHYHN